MFSPCDPCCGVSGCAVVVECGYPLLNMPGAMSGVLVTATRGEKVYGSGYSDGDGFVSLGYLPSTNLTYTASASGFSPYSIHYDTVPAGCEVLYPKGKYRVRVNVSAVCGGGMNNVMGSGISVAAVRDGVDVSTGVTSDIGTGLPYAYLCLGHVPSGTVEGRSAPLRYSNPSGVSVTDADFATSNTKNVTLTMVPEAGYVCSIYDPNMIPWAETLHVSSSVYGWNAPVTFQRSPNSVFGGWSSDAISANFPGCNVFFLNQGVFECPSRSFDLYAIVNSNVLVYGYDTNKIDIFPTTSFYNSVCPGDPNGNYTSFRSNLTQLTFQGAPDLLMVSSGTPWGYCEPSIFTVTE